VGKRPSKVKERAGGKRTGKIERRSPVISTNRSLLVGVNSGTGKGERQEGGGDQQYLGGPGAESAKAKMRGSG